MCGAWLIALISGTPTWAGSIPEGLEGAGTAEQPYLIEDLFDLLYLRQKIESQSEYTRDRHFILTSDIYVNHDILDDNGILKADTTALDKWTPLGSDSYSHAFAGTFDGNGHSIHGIYINDLTSGTNGLFGYLGKTGEIRNLTLRDSYILGNGDTGGIAGNAQGSIINCVSYAMVVAKGYALQVGGIAGYNGSDSELKGCVNHGIVIGDSSPDEYGGYYNCSTGGIIGANMGVVDSCYNRGRIEGRGFGAVGGIVGSAGYPVYNSVNEGSVTSNHDVSLGGIAGYNTTSIYRCINRGSVYAQAPESWVGGIAGSNNFNASVWESENHVDIICDLDSVYVGGIVGNLNGGRSYNTYYTPKVYSSVNYGAVSTSGETSMCGGIAGKSYCGEVHGCTNHGTVISNRHAGGILPLGEFHTNIYGCTNTGRIEGSVCTGGIAGKTNGSVYDCFNSGRILTASRDNEVGGVVGWLDGSSGSIYRCVNTGEISGGWNVGGVAGYNETRSSISYSYNAGYVHSDTPDCHMGGLSGGTGNIRNCYNAGPVHAMADGISIGGVTYSLWVSYDSHGNRSGSTASNSYNAGDIIIDGADCTVGNIAGSYTYSDATALFKNCFYLDNAIYGEGYTNSDLTGTYTREGHMEAVSCEGFRTLATSLNENSDYWEPAPYSQGHRRPLLQYYEYDDESFSPVFTYDVTTMTGDSVRIDLGLPMANEYFLTDTDSGIANGFNVSYGGRVRRAKLVDGAEYALPSPVSVESLYYVRHAGPAYNTACLPVEVSPEDFGTALLTPSGTDGETMYLRETDMAAADSPFIFDASALGGKVAFTRRDVVLGGSVPAENGMLAGTYSMMTDFPADAMVLSEDGTTLRRASKENTLMPMRAYFVTGLEADTLTLKADGLNDAETVTLADAGIYGTDGAIEVDTAGETLAAHVYTIDGECVAGSGSLNGKCRLAVPSAGIYIVTVGGNTVKVIVR